VFLADGLGALLSAGLLGLVLPWLQSYIGMPVPVLQGLALLASLFAAYSLSCFVFADHSKPLWLRLIATANTAYCGLTLALALHYRDKVTLLGWAYFLGESAIVLSLVAMERRLPSALAEAQESDR
jgi:hypothetical protein